MNPNSPPMGLETLDMIDFPVTLHLRIVKYEQRPQNNRAKKYYTYSFWPS